MKKVLYVDDEPMNLKLFEINFKRKFDIYTCESPLDVLELIQKENINVIITDYKMPEMNGLELIEKVKSQKPHTLCMVISGFVDSKVITEKKLVYKFIPKPYKTEEVTLIIEEAFNQLV